MKVKIKGLVFVGFAAAVFAQSAMAANPSYQTAANTVTSKKYVDEKFQTLENIVTTTEAAQAGFQWTGQTAEATYPSIALLNEVKGQVSGINVNGDETYIHVADGTGEAEGTFTVSPLRTPASTAAEITGASGTNDASTLVTVAAVKAAVQTSVSSSSTDAQIPTAKAVYDYAQPSVADDNGAGVYLGKWNESGSVGAWQQLTTSGYVTVDTTNNGYAIVLDSSTITGTGANAADDITAAGELVGDNDTITDAEKSKLTTAKSVYDFVSGGYQPVAPAGIKVGNNGDWDTLAVDTTYLGLNTSTTGTVQVTVNTATAASGISGASTSSSTGASNLTTAYAVNAYVQGLLHGNEIPVMPSECSTAAASGHYCALVYGVTSGTAGQEGATYGLMWTIMAPES